VKSVYIRGLLVAPTLIVLFAVSLCAQTSFVYTNNNIVSFSNSVSGFSIGVDGALTEIPGSPFQTGGIGNTFGGLVSTNRITACVVGNTLYVANDGSNNVSALSINPSTGFLTPVPGSPFATGGTAGQGISVACTPDGRFLMAGHEGSGNIAVFNIAANGSLTPILGSPFSAGGKVATIKVTPDARFLVATLRFSNVITLSIGSNGALAPAGSANTGGTTRGVDMNCASTLLFGGDVAFGMASVRVLSIGSNGTIAEIPGSPFTTSTADNSNVVLLSPNERFLFVSNQASNTITVFNVAPNGFLTLLSGSPFPVNGGDTPSGLGINQAGTLLYSTNFPLFSIPSISAFGVGSEGSLTAVPGSPFPTHRSGASALLSLVIYPGKSCAAGAFDICLQDDSSGDTLKFNSATGDYQFTSCGGPVLGGKGSVIKRGSIITLQQNAGDRRVLARLDGSVNKGTASIQVLSLGTTFSITDRNTSNNTCACP
jgi:6-phosphogluconolactonase